MLAEMLARILDLKHPPHGGIALNVDGNGWQLLDAQFAGSLEPVAAIKHPTVQCDPKGNRTSPVSRMLAKTIA